MSRSVDVNLSIVDEEEDGYTRAKDIDENYIDYWYKYTGGDDGNGNDDDGDVTTGPGNKVEIIISLEGASNGKYDLKEAGWKSGAEPYDMGVTSTGPNKIVIWDFATFPGSAEYTIVANPKNATTPDIYCDPMIVNDWGGGGTFRLGPWSIEPYEGGE